MARRSLQPVTTRSRALPPPRPDAGALFSVGYEHFALEDFVACMVRHRIDLVMDVRLNAVSRRPGFSKRSLGTGLGAAGVEYRHEPRWGNPPDNRAAFRRGDGGAGRRRMRALVEDQAADLLHATADLLRHRRLALLCVEGDDARCHRSVITDALARMVPGLEVTALP